MHRPRKRFGQHFLNDRSVVERIIASIDPQPGDRLVEIGPGLGALTLPLLQRVERLEAVEIDRDAVRHLRATTNPAALHVHEGDVLAFDFGALREGAQKLRLVGNLPYNISTPLLFKLIERREHLRDMHFMLQKEVVERMAATAGQDHYGRLSVMLAPWLKVEPLFDVSPAAFRPPPRVMSTIVRLTAHEVAPFKLHAPARFAAIVAAAFSQRRKTLRNALKPLLSEQQILKAGIDPSLRAEVIAPAAFAALSVVDTTPATASAVPDFRSHEADL